MKNKAGFWIRVQAYLIDALLMLLTIIMPIWIISIRLISLEEILPAIGILLYYIAFLFPLLALLYKVVMTSKFGGGIGKLVSGIKVVDGKGKLLRFFPSLFRYLVGYFISSLLFNLGFLWVARDKNKQGWHDQVSGTYVIVGKEKRCLLGSIVLLLMIFLNSFFVSNTVQSIKQNRTLQGEMQTLIQEVSASLLENNKTPATIEPQQPPNII